MRNVSIPTLLALGLCVATLTAVPPALAAAPGIHPQDRVEKKYPRDLTKPAPVPQAVRVHAATNRPIFAPSQPQTITPGGTFSRPQTTFSPQTGSFSRPASTFSHPGSSYIPLPPIQVPVHNPTNHPSHRPRHHLAPHIIFIEPPVIYEPAIPAETPAPTASVETTPVETAPAPAEPPIVLDLPPGATIRRIPAQTPTQETSPK